MEEKTEPEEDMTILEQWMDMYMRDNPEKFLKIKNKKNDESGSC